MKNNRVSTQCSSTKEILLSRSELERLITRDSLKISSNRLFPEKTPPATHWRCCTFDGRSDDSYVFLYVDKNKIESKKSKELLTLHVDSIKEIKPLSKKGLSLLQQLRDYKNEPLLFGDPYFPEGKEGFLSLEDSIQYPQHSQKSAILSRAERMRLESKGFLLLDKTRILASGEPIKNHLSKFPDLQIDPQNLYYCEFKVGEEGIIFKESLTKDFYFTENPLPSCKSQTKSSPDLLEQLKNFISDQLIEEKKQSAKGFIHLLVALGSIKKRNIPKDFFFPDLTEGEIKRLNLFDSSTAYPIKAAFMVVTRKFAEEMKKEKTSGNLKDEGFLVRPFNYFYEKELKELKEEIEEVRKNRKLSESILDDPLCKKISEKINDATNFYCIKKKIKKNKEKEFSPFSFEQLVFFFKYSRLFAGNEAIDIQTFFNDLRKLENNSLYCTENIKVYWRIGSFLTKESFTSLSYFLRLEKNIEQALPKQGGAQNNNS